MHSSALQVVPKKIPKTIHNNPTLPEIKRLGIITFLYFLYKNKFRVKRMKNTIVQKIKILQNIEG
jgi:hypothetical protein